MISDFKLMDKYFTIISTSIYLLYKLQYEHFVIV
jgi:hypothetical protein